MAKITLYSGTVEIKFDRFHNLNKSFEPVNSITYSLHGLRIFPLSHSLVRSIPHFDSFSLDLTLAQVILFSTILKLTIQIICVSTRMAVLIFLDDTQMGAHHRLLFRCVLFLKFCFSLNCTASCACLCLCLFDRLCLLLFVTSSFYICIRSNKICRRTNIINLNHTTRNIRTLLTK